MEISVDSVYERDIDFLIMESFHSCYDFTEIFCDAAEIAEAEVIRIAHSVEDSALGETDICVWLEMNESSIVFLIENKIDAEAQPMQYERYVERAEKMKSEEGIDEYYIFITAPEEYLRTNAMAQKYPIKISYEKMLKYFSGKNECKAAMLRKAIEKKENGYTPVEDCAVTAFWKEYYKYQRDYFPELILPVVDGPRGTKACWATFKTKNPSGKLEVWHKADRGFVDLQLPGLGAFEYDIRKLLGERLEHDMAVCKAGKSAAIRIEIAKVDFHKPFMNYKKEMKDVFTVVKRLSDFAENLDYAELCRKLNN